jgi:hypothetical protein
VAGDWRLPNVKELQSLIDFGTFFPALPPGHPFSGVQSTFYWSSTTNADHPALAWNVNLNDGNTTTTTRTTPTWCGRSGGEAARGWPPSRRHRTGWHGAADGVSSPPP